MSSDRWCLKSAEATADLVVMSLTSELDDPNGELRRFLDVRFSHGNRLVREVREKTRDSQTIRPREPVSLGTVATAADYRIRLYFVDVPQADSPPIGGAAADLLGEIVSRARVVIGRGVVPEPLAAEFCDSFWAMLTELRPRARRLTTLEEDQLCRHCHALALFEEIYRAGPRIRSPLFDLSARSGLNDLLELASPASVSDLCAMSWAFFDSQPELLNEDAILGPTFDGSLSVGGADADLLVGRCLVEIKTTLDPGKVRSGSGWPWQLLGYALLDFSDRYRIEQVALYLARQAMLLRWPLDEFVSLFAGEETAVADVRRAAQAVLPASARPPAAA